MPEFIHGVHDRGAEHLHADKPGWTLVTEAIGCDPSNVSGADYTDLSSRGFGVIVRLNNGYGNQTGTIPLPNKFTEYAATCAAWVAKSKGANIWVISNEVNHEAERPNGVFITPEEYAGLFTLTRNAIKRVSLLAQVIPAPIAPYHANPMNWLDYLHRMLEVIEYQGDCDGIAIHAYTRSANPTDIFSNAKMGPPLQDQYSGFRTYQDALGAVPLSLRNLPAYILEFDEYETWEDSNTGVVRAAYHEIDQWNLLPGMQGIHALLLYRYSDSDKWGIINKPGVKADFREVVQRGYTVPELRLPSIKQPSGPTAIVTAPGGANIRIGPGLSYKILGAVTITTELTIIGRSADRSWWKVDSVFEIGWVSNEVVNVVNAENVPVILVTVPISETPTAPADSNWQKSYDFVLRMEGGLSTDALDPGNYRPDGSFGGTKYGISARQYPSLDIEHLSREQALSIYERDYWQPSGASQLPFPLSMAVFDQAVNGGVGSARQLLQKSGPYFISFMAARLLWYTEIDNFDRYGRSWIRRMSDLMVEAGKSA